MANRNDPTLSDMLERWRPNQRWFELYEIDKSDDEAKARLISSALAAKHLFDIVDKYIDEKVKELEATEESLDDFKDGSWSEKQAFRNGQRAAYKRIKRFLP